MYDTSTQNPTERRDSQYRIGGLRFERGNNMPTNEPSPALQLSELFRAVIDSDGEPVVICTLDHTIVYMNPTAVRRYEKRGGAALVGRSLLDCHAPSTREIIGRILAWFGESSENNSVFETHIECENADVYMVALRAPDGRLIGYYEKHESRIPHGETKKAQIEKAETSYDN